MLKILLTPGDIAASASIEMAPPGIIATWRDEQCVHWSTGALEKALRRLDSGVLVVATTRSILMPSDRWWVEIVGRDNVFLAEPEDTNRLISMADSMKALRQRSAWQSAGWRKAFEKLGIPWPTNSNGIPLDWSETLPFLRQHSVLTGRDVMA